MRLAIARVGVLSVVCAFLNTACLFTVQHELPPNAYFGKLPHQSGEKTSPLTDHGMKNWGLAGLAAYSDWSSKDLLQPNGVGPHHRVEDLAIETRFGKLDTLFWVVPGFAYGYYVWATRTVEVSGSRVDRPPTRR